MSHQKASPILHCASCPPASQQTQQFADMAELEAHVAADHLDYFPYGCGHCSHWLASDALIKFHAETRNHLPLKIRENLVMSKERELRAILADSLKESGVSAHSDTSSSVVSMTPKERSSPKSQLHRLLDSAQQARLKLESTTQKQAPKRPRDSPDGNETLAELFSKNTRHQRHARSTYSPHEDSAQNEGEPNESPKESNPDGEKKHRATDRSPDGDEMESGETIPPPADEDHTFKCAVCVQRIALCNLEKHARAHYKLPDDGYMYSCVQCDYVGRSNVSVVTHFTHRHGKRASRANYVPIEAKDGVRELSVEETTALIIDKCFNSSNNVEMNCSELSESRHSNANGDDTFPAISESVGLMSTPWTGSSKSPGLGTAKKLMKSAIKRSLKERVRPHLTCSLCGARVYSAVAAQHVYEQHVRLSDTVQCGLCEFGSMYSATPVLQHMTHMHQGSPAQVRDRRKDAQRQALYLEYRDKCFPNVFNRAPNGALLPPRNSFFGGDPGVDAETPQVGCESAAEAAGGDMSAMEKELRQDRDFDQFAAAGQAAAAPLSTMAGRSFTTAKCKLCSTDVIFMQRHAWRHLYNEKGIVPFRCMHSGCTYKTYLKRSFDSHHESMHKGQPTLVADRRRKYSPHLADMMQRCFDRELVFKGDKTITQEPTNSSTEMNASTNGNTSKSTRGSTPKDDTSGGLKCRICNVNVPHSEAREHVKRRHVRRAPPSSESPPMFVCKHCGEMFDREDKVQDHAATSHSDLPISYTSSPPGCKDEDIEAIRGEWFRCFGVRTPFIDVKSEMS